MAYSKTIWKNRVVEKPRTFTVTNNPDGTITLTPSEGTIAEAGTPITADKMNNIEMGLYKARHLFVDCIDGTIQYPTFDSNGNITKIEHKDSQNNILRTDTFGYYSLANLVQNGNFINSSYWNTYFSTLTVSNNTASVTPSGQWGAILQNATTEANIGDIVYLCALINTNVSNKIQLVLEYKTGYGFDSQFITQTSQFVFKSCYGAMPSNKTYTRALLNDSRTSGWDAWQVKNVIMLNLTSIFGAGKEPTKAEMDAIIQNFGGFIDTTPVQLIIEKRTLNTGEVLTLKYYFDANGNYLRTEVI